MNDHLGTLARYKALILLVAVIMAAAAYLTTKKQAPRYQATSKLLVNQNPWSLLPNATATITDPTLLERLTSTQIHLAQIPAVADSALRLADVRTETPTQLLGNVTLSEETNADLIDVSVTAGTPSQAERLSTAYAIAFARYQRGLVHAQLSSELAGVQATIGPALTTGGQSRSAKASSVSFQQLLSLRDDLTAAVASVPRTSVLASSASSAVKTAPKPLRNSALALVLGLILGSGLAFLIAARDRRGRSTEEISEMLGLNLLARIPAPARGWRRSRQGSPVTMLRDPGTAQAEAIKMLQANLELARLHGSAQVVLFTSAIGQEGKSMTVANLAVSLAQAGRTVAVVDADLRKPTVSRLFEVPEQPGLAELAQGEVAPEQVGDLLVGVELGAVMTARSVRGTLRVLPAGRREEHPDRLLSSRALPDVFGALRADADWVLVDTPPMTKFYDSFIVSQYVDALIAVARVGHVQLPTLAEFGRVLAGAPVQALGYVATGVGAKYAARYDFPRTQTGGDGPVRATAPHA